MDDSGTACPPRTPKDLLGGVLDEQKADHYPQQSERDAFATESREIPPPMSNESGTFRRGTFTVARPSALPNLVAQAIAGMPTKRAMDWIQEQVVQALEGQLKAGGA